MKSIRAAIYCRVSTDSQTTESQRRELEAFCAREGWQIYKVYEDKGISGAQHERPALSEMLRDAHDKAFDLLLCWKIDRVARSVPHLLEVLTTLRSLDIGFCSLTESISTENAQGRMLILFLGAIAEFERELCSQRIKSSLARVVANGGKLGRKRVGFDIGRALELRKKGLGYKQVARELGVARTTLFRTLRTIPQSSAVA